jgi:hypothetical protein
LFKDTILVIEKYKSGFLPPDDIPFEDLSKGGSDSGSANNINNIQISGKLKEGGYTVKGTITGKAMKKRAGIFHIFGSRGNAAISDGKEDLSDLPPNQRRKRLTQKVEELKGKVAQETAAKDGLMKMKGVYEANPALGDPMTIEGQLNECSHRLDKLQGELKRFQGYLEEAVKGIQSGQNNSLTNSPRLVNGSRHHRNSGGSAAEEESLSRSASDSSVTNPTINHNKQSAPGTPQLNHGPESGLGTSHTSLPGVDSDPDQYDGHPADPESEYYEADLLAPMGICKALYPFEGTRSSSSQSTIVFIGVFSLILATSEGSIPMAQDEELHLIEEDQGDGWTRVRRMHGEFEEGFVPTSYIETTLFNK